MLDENWKIAWWVENTGWAGIVEYAALGQHGLSMRTPLVVWLEQFLDLSVPQFP